MHFVLFNGPKIFHICVWRVAANILSIRPQTGNKMWSLSLQVGQVANNSAWHKTNMLQNLMFVIIHSCIVTTHIYMML